MSPLFYSICIVLSLFSQSIFANEPIRLATTTSTENSGLLSNILPFFEKKSGYKVHVIAVGTGKALELGRRGDVDVILVHAKNAELEFVNQGFGIKRFDVMYNDFVLVGPAEDPAQIKGKLQITQALSLIEAKNSMFISRGDNSGTHKKEKTLWQKTNLSPSGYWYREIGQGMGKTLNIANELQAYTLVDRGTWLAYKDKVSLKLLVEGDPQLFNPYGIIAINPEKHQATNQSGANSLINWLTGSQGQQLVGNFKIAGKQLFKPSAQK